MTDIKLSIIVPHYNSGDLLKKLLSTIPDIPEVQTIIVDDHSTDKIDEYENCRKEYADSNVEFYVNECAKSAGGARNTGLKYAKGKWLLFADADDYFLPDFYNCVKEYFDCEYDLVYFRSTSIDLFSGKTADRHLQMEQLIQDYLYKPNRKWTLRLKFNYFSPCAKLVRRELLDKFDIKFDEVMVANDVMCSIKLAYNTEKIFVSDKIIYCITKQPGTLTTYVTEERYDARMKIYYKRHQFLRDHLSKKDYRLLRFGARVRLRNVKENNLGRKKYFQVLKQMMENKIPIWREFSPSYYYEILCYIWKDLKKRYLK